MRGLVQERLIHNLFEIVSPNGVFPMLYVLQYVLHKGVVDPTLRSNFRKSCHNNELATIVGGLENWGLIERDYTGVNGGGNCDGQWHSTKRGDYYHGELVQATEYQEACHGSFTNYFTEMSRQPIVENSIIDFLRHASEHPAPRPISDVFQGYLSSEYATTDIEFSKFVSVCKKLKLLTPIEHSWALAAQTRVNLEYCRKLSKARGM